MVQFRISIYWKIFLTILASMVLSALLIGSLYLGFDPRTKIHQQIQKSLLLKTNSTADRITSRIKTSSQPLEEILREIHAQEKENLIVYDTSARQLACFVEEGLKNKEKISKQIIQNTLRLGWNIQLIYPNLVLTPIISVPLKLNHEKTIILQSYYPFTKGVKRIIPGGLPEVIMVIFLGGLTVLVTRYLTRPLRGLTRVARETAKGNFGAQVKIRSHDEVGQLTEAFNKMSQRLAEMRNSRKELFADISHEIRSPLARILTDAEILIDGQMDAQGREQHLKAICNEVKNLDQLTGDLAILARVDQDQVDISFTPSSLKDVISQAVSLFMLQIEEKGIHLKQPVSENVPQVIIDPKRIGQVISNLLTNALRYTPPGGTIEVGLRQRNEAAEVWVRDTGPGIPENKLPLIFERFYRVDKSRSRATGGSGLGLAIARQFVESHGGKIRAESKREEGTCITFRLPIVS
jgi:signal transduction histidine kinase